MSVHLPANPSLEYLRKQAKSLLKSYQAGDSQVLSRITEWHPSFSSLSKFGLRDAQVVIAREYGFDNWSELKKHVQSLQPPADEGALRDHGAIVHSVIFYEREVRKLSIALTEDWPQVTERIRSHLSRSSQMTDDQIRTQLTEDDLHQVIASETGFHNWETLRSAVESRDNEPQWVDKFLDLACLSYDPVYDEVERIKQARSILEEHPEITTHSIHAAAAVGESSTVERFLRKDPTLVHAKGGPRYWEPLLYTCYSRINSTLPGQNTLEAASVLIANAAEPNTFWNDPWGNKFTALTGAIGEGEQGLQRCPPHQYANDMAILLLDAGTNPNDSQGLYNSMFTPGNEWLELLLRYGLKHTDPGNWNDREPSTMNFQLAYAVKVGFIDRVALLLKHGADPNFQSDHKNLPTHLLESARNDGYVGIAELIVKHRATSPDEVE